MGMRCCEYSFPRSVHGPRAVPLQRWYAEDWLERTIEIASECYWHSWDFQNPNLLGNNKAVYDLVRRMMKLCIKEFQSAWLKGSTREQRASIREHKGSKWTIRALARDQSGKASVNKRLRVIWNSRILYIFYIYPELRIRNCRSGTGKGASREQWGAAK